MPDVEPPEAETNNHELLKTLEMNAARPSIPMSSHNIKTTYTPKNFHEATHVYVRIENPENLGCKYSGPFEIVDRPSNTTATIKVGLTKDGVPRLQTHHWENLRVGLLRPDAQLKLAPKRGRPCQNKTTSTDRLHATIEDNLITQPRSQDDRATFENSAAGAEFGSIDTPLPSSTTGPPPVPFSKPKQSPSINGKQTSKPALPANSGPALPEPATSSQQGFGSHLRNNEPPSWQPPETSAATSTPTFSPSRPAEPTSSPSYSAEIADHDYIQRPPRPLTDHNYFMSVPLPDPDPRVNPPPGFAYPPQHAEQGRPQRKRSLPTRFSDYDLS